MKVWSLGKAVHISTITSVTRGVNRRLKLLTVINSVLKLQTYRQGKTFSYYWKVRAAECVETCWIISRFGFSASASFLALLNGIIYALRTITCDGSFM